MKVKVYFVPCSIIFHADTAFGDLKQGMSWNALEHPFKNNVISSGTV